MSPDPYRDLNRVHRDLVDLPCPLERGEAGFPADMGDDAPHVPSIVAIMIGVAVFLGVAIFLGCLDSIEVWERARIAENRETAR